MFDLLMAAVRLTWRREKKATYFLSQQVARIMIAPGFFVTDLTKPVWEQEGNRAWVRSRIPLGRPGTPDDIIGTIVYLVSPAI